MSDWDGWGPGMSSPKIADAKRILARYSYGKGLGDSEAWTPELTAAMTTYQQRVHALVVAGRREGPDVRSDGRMGWATQVQLGIIDRPPVELPVMLTAQGTGVDMWTGPPADTARALAARELVQFQPLGNWPARPFPNMWGSIMEGVAEGEVQARRWGGDEGRDLILCGYSQGAVVASFLWKFSFADGGNLADLRHKVISGVTWGNPCREEGRFTGDGCDWDARPDTSGIMAVQNRLVDTPDWWVDYAHKGDLYTDCEMGDEGEFKRAICKMIMGHEWLSGPDNILAQICELFARPLAEGWAALQAIIDAGMFFGSGTHPHVDYCTAPAVDYLAALLDAG